MNSPKKILIIRFSSIGDIVLSTALLRALRVRFPMAQIDYVTRSEFADLVRYNQNLNHTYTWDRRDGVPGLLRIIRELRREDHDLVVDIHHSLRSRLIRMCLRASSVVWIDKRLRERRRLIQDKANEYSSVVSVADRYIEPVGHLGVVADGKGLELHIPDAVTMAVAGRCSALGLNAFEKVFGLCPGARHFTKRWPAERFTALGVQLAKTYRAKILIFGGPDEKGLCAEIAGKISSEVGVAHAADLSGTLDLLKTASAFEFCDAVVCNDSGLMHIAAAMKRPLVAFFGSTVREFGFFPIGTNSRVLEEQGLSCRPCSHIGLASCPEGHFKCLRDIEVSRAAQAVHEIISPRGS
jgi:lipopolysaccharide heptosyltransferase II